MNKTLKWILIGLAIALGVFLIALPIFYMARYAGNLADIGRQVMPFRTGYHMPFQGRMPMMGIFGLSRVLLPLAVIGFAVYGVVALVRRGKPKVTTAVPPALPLVPAAERSCVSCGKSLQNEGEFCPFCGVKQ